ncbi:hypothetical protein X733_33450 [Mesorhizobium sp. L2C067A000]|nr:hypothetical protein X733_33450 [Mesorhizobium sp. L2C067A000]
MIIGRYARVQLRLKPFEEAMLTDPFQMRPTVAPSTPAVRPPRFEATRRQA